MEEIAKRIVQSQGGDKAARDQLIRDNLGLVWSIVRRFDNRGYEREDLFQIGTIGLIKAIDKFDVTYEVCFSTYAVPMITGEIKRFLRDDSMIKVSRSLKESAARIRMEETRLQNELGRDVTLQELAEATHMECEEIVMALEANSEVESIYRPVGQSEGNEICLADRLVETRDENQKLLDHMLLNQLIEGLNHVEKQLIVLRFFQEKTQSQVAKCLGMSQVQISRMEKKILERLRRKAEN